MKRDWIKLQLDILNNPTYGLLSDDLFRRLVELYLLAGEKDQEGLLPDVEDMAWRLRADPEELLYCLWGLLERGLVDETPQGWMVTGFKESQAAPNSTERSRASRRRRLFATEPGEAGDEVPVQSAARCGTEDAAEMQPSSPYPVAVPVAVIAPTPNPVPGQPKLPGRARHRHKTKKRPVEKPVDNFVEKGRNISVSPEPTSSSSLTNSLKNSLNIKLPLLELTGPNPENFRLWQGKTLKNKCIDPGTAHFAGMLKAAHGRIDPGAGQILSALEGMQVPFDKTVDNFVEKSRKISDPVKIPP